MKYFVVLILAGAIGYSLQNEMKQALRRGKSSQATHGNEATIVAKDMAPITKLTKNNKTSATDTTRQTHSGAVTILHRAHEDDDTPIKTERIKKKQALRGGPEEPEKEATFEENLSEPMIKEETEHDQIKADVNRDENGEDNKQDEIIDVKLARGGNNNEDEHVQMVGTVIDWDNAKSEDSDNDEKKTDDDDRKEEKKDSDEAEASGSEVLGSKVIKKVVKLKHTTKPTTKSKTKHHKRKHHTKKRPHRNRVVTLKRHTQKGQVYKAVTHKPQSTTTRLTTTTDDHWGEIVDIIMTTEESAKKDNTDTHDKDKIDRKTGEFKKAEQIYKNMEKEYNNLLKEYQIMKQKYQKAQNENIQIRKSKSSSSSSSYEDLTPILRQTMQDNGSEAGESESDSDLVYDLPDKIKNHRSK